MSTNLNNYLYLTLAAILALPLFVFAQVNFPAGLNSCGSGGGALSGGLGSSRPIGGPFVPVADYAVELNTATLVYKECILRITVNTQKKAAAALITRDTVNKFMTQRNGGPMFPVIMQRDIGRRTDAAMVRTLNDGTLQTLNPSFYNRVRGAVALSYRVDTRVRNNTIACPEPNINTISRAQDFSFGLFWREADPRCQPLYAYYNAKELVEQDLADDYSEMMYRLNSSDGVYGVEAIDADGNRMTLSPGTIVKDNTIQAIQSGFAMLIQADDIGEITDALYASMGDQAMTGIGGQSTTQGLASLTGGLPGQGVQNSASTYLDQVLRNQFGGGGGGGNPTGTSTTPGSLLQALQALLQSEIQYLNVATQQGQLLSRTNQSLASSSVLCWSSTTQSDAAFAPYAPRVVDTATNLQDSTTAVAGLQSMISALQSSNPPSPASVQQQLGTLNIHTDQQLQTQIQTLQTWSQELYPTFVQNMVDQWLANGAQSVCAMVTAT